MQNSWLYAIETISGGFKERRKFLGGPVVRTLCFHCRGPRFPQLSKETTTEREETHLKDVEEVQRGSGKAAEPGLENSLDQERLDSPERTVRPA